MEGNLRGLRKEESVVLLLGLIVLIVMILISGKPPLYDEDDYLLNVALLQQYGFSDLYLINHKGSAGPLFSALHYILEPVTNLQTPHIRLVNIALLSGSMWFSGRTLNVLGLPRSYALLAMAIPMTYVISGMALTEIPAIFFLSAALYLIIKVCYSNMSFPKAAAQLALGGLLLSLAILGRQPFLLVLAALPILFWKKNDFLKKTILLIITIVFALAIPAYIFSVWGGLVAPGDASFYQSTTKDELALQPVFFFLCIAYYAVIFLIVSPQFYLKPHRRQTIIFAILALISVALNVRYELFSYLPMKSVVEQIFPPVVAGLTGTVSGAGLILLSIYFLLTLIRQLIKSKFSPGLMFIAATILLIAIACIKITWGFSSRYPAQALPFLVPMFAYFYGESRFNTYRLATGCLLGLLSFASFMAGN